ncbi:MAG TPA: thioesterase family protein [Chitinophagaceae bacterium]|nr:thioesterase family protein [Chitinophagaceae bacterium]
MSSYQKKIELRWSDLDPNFHLRHSAYYDFGAYIRISYFNDHGLSNQVLIDNHFGPILFREECIFRKELKMNDELTINLEVVKARKDLSRWTIQHQFMRNGQLAAVLTVDGAWIDTQLRKLTNIPEQYRHIMESMPRAENFEWIVK